VGMAERVIVACPLDRMTDWSAALKSLSARGEIVVPELLRFAPARIDEFDGQPTIIVAGGPLHFRDRLIKRLFDLIVATVATILLSPILIGAALAVRLSSPGPALFRQPRIGKDARPFAIYKFRSMRSEASDHKAATLTKRDDDRVTRVGAFLRKTSIDELPQLFNVLKGDMSIVGPRPHAAAAKAGDSLYWEVDARYWERPSRLDRPSSGPDRPASIRPGICQRLVDLARPADHRRHAGRACPSQGLLSNGDQPDPCRDSAALPDGGGVAVSFLSADPAPAIDAARNARGRIDAQRFPAVLRL
jgi:lipopolysaccharide/colanic/teichoic acid biosynthesis glycosyltransferase